jgi:predicted RecB family nuclease
MPQLTEKHFYKYIKCPLWLYFDTHEEEHRLHDPLVDRLQEDGLLDEVQRQMLDGRDYAEVEIEDVEEAYLKTLELMKQGVQTIYHGVLVHGHWVGRPDLLEKVEGKSRFGEYYYVACDIKRTRRPRREHMFQGAFYAEILRYLQGVKPVQGYVITPDGEVKKYLIEEFETAFHLSLDQIERIMAGKRPSHFVTSGCKQSPWAKECRATAVDCDDITLLNRVHATELNALRKAGIERISAFSKMDIVDLVKSVPELDEERLVLLRDQATALTQGTHIVRQPLQLPKFERELYFDVESDPLRDLDYLFGVLEVEGEESTYHSFLAKEPKDEPKAWQEFVEFMRSREGLPIYHYGFYELEVIRRQAKRHGTDMAVIEKMEASMVDMLPVLRDAIIFPVYFYSLKDIAKYIGYQWDEKDVSGVDSVVWYEDFLANRRKTSVLKKIVKYNEDDVRATWLVKKWSEQQDA